MHHINYTFNITWVVFIAFFFLSGCTSSAEITYVKRVSSDGLDESYKPVKGVNFDLFIDSKIIRDDTWLVELRSKSDLIELIKKHEMAYLYYRLSLCEASGNKYELLTAPIFVQSGNESDEFIYYAPINKDLKPVIRAHLELIGREVPSQLENICINLGAGNMLRNLETNRLRLDWLSL